MVGEKYEAAFEAQAAAGIAVITGKPGLAIDRAAATYRRRVRANRRRLTPS
jgi:hypothetical protein